MFSGIFIFAAVVGNVGDAITSMNESKTTYQKRADAIKLYMQHHGVPDVLQRKVSLILQQPPSSAVAYNPHS